MHIGLRGNWKQNLVGYSVFEGIILLLIIPQFGGIVYIAAFCATLLKFA